MTKQITKIYNEIRKTNTSDGKYVYVIDYSFFWWSNNKQGGTSPSMLDQEYFFKLSEAKQWLNNNRELVVDQLGF